MLNRDEVKGKIESAKGSMKERLGRATSAPELEAEGRVEKTTGHLREKYGTAKRKTGEFLEKTGREIKH